MQSVVKTLNTLYQEESSLHRNDVEKEGFAWIDENDYQANVISFIRKGAKNKKSTLVVCNFSDKEHLGYILGVPSKGEYEVIFNSDSEEFGGETQNTLQVLEPQKEEQHGQKHSIKLTIAPLSVIYLQKIK